MKKLLILLAAVFFASGFAQAQNTNPATSNDVRLLVTVMDSIPLRDFRGSLTPTGDFDPRFALTVRIDSCVPAITNLKFGTIIALAVHSPALFLKGSAEKGKAHEITMPRTKAVNLLAEQGGSHVPDAPLLKVDHWHWMSKSGAGSHSRPYRIGACDRVILDFTDYTFTVPEKLKGTSPNLIRVRWGDFMDGNVCDLSIQPDKKRYELSAATLPKGISRDPFTRFYQSFHYVIEIGVCDPDGTFTQQWCSIIEVQ